MNRFLSYHSNSRGLKNLILLGAGFIIIAIFFLVPANRSWFNKSVLAYWRDFTIQRNNLDIEKRKKERFGAAYTFSKEIAAVIAQQQSADALVLIPPSDFFRKKGVDYHVPEPAVFYYYTGVKTVWANNANADKANWYVTAANGNILVVRVTSPDSLQNLITAFKKYPITL